MVDVVTGVPIALLVWPPFRNWVSVQPWATLAFSVVIALRVIYGAWRRAEKRRTRERAIRETQVLSLPAVELAAAYHYDRRDGRISGDHTLRRIVSGILQQFVALVAEALDVPESTELHANLMLPMQVLVDGKPGTADGIGIVAYNMSAPASPSWTKVVRGDLVAGTVMDTGKVEVVEDTNDPTWQGIFSTLRSRSFVTFPVRGPSGIIGVVNIDSDEPMTFRRKNVTKYLWPVLAPQLALLSQVLIASASDTHLAPTAPATR